MEEEKHAGWPWLLSSAAICGLATLAGIWLERTSAAPQIATGLYATVQQVSSTLGVTIGAASLTITMALSGTHTPQLADFTTAFLVVACFALASFPVSLILPRNAAQDVSGHSGRR